MEGSHGVSSIFLSVQTSAIRTARKPAHPGKGAPAPLRN
ncbi:unnamed protein product [Ciceribacter sp. T2.26MG-112.2]|nr:unnamed protein product [Ciceribacter naphthalenivorans]